MKTSGKKIKVPFHFTEKESSFLFGIVSKEPDYKLSFMINSELKLALKNSTPVEIPDENGSMITFSRFSDNSKAPHLTYSLVSNKTDKNPLLKKLKSYDFLFIVHDEEEELDELMLTKKLKESGLFTAVFNIDPKEINDRNLQYLIH